MNRRSRELETELEQCKVELEQLKKQLAEQTNKINEYQTREQAVVLALTEAQATATRRISLAKDEANAILKDAEHKKQTIDEQVNGLLEKAQAEANVIVEQAREQVKTQLLQTQASVVDYQERLHALNAHLKEAAQRAHRLAEQFSSAMQSCVTALPDTVAEVRDLTDLVQADLKDLPEQYDSPSDLMHSIYAIEGRDIPRAVKKEPTAAAIQAPADDHEASEPVDCAPPSPPVESKKNETAEPDEERVWTVDEVVAQVQEEDVDPDLDHLLEEIMQ